VKGNISKNPRHTMWRGGYVYHLCEVMLAKCAKGICSRKLWKEITKEERDNRTVVRSGWKRMRIAADGNRKWRVKLKGNAFKFWRNW